LSIAAVAVDGQGRAHSGGGDLRPYLRPRRGCESGVVGLTGGVIAMRSYVVVGVDGSPSSVAAAQYAADVAASFGQDVHLLHGYGHHVESFDDALRRLAVLLETRHPGLAVACHQVPGGGAAALVEESETATLTVVGCRGAGTISSVALGATATMVATHAHGPVSDGTTFLHQRSPSGNAFRACPSRTEMRRRPGRVALKARRLQGCRPARTGPSARRRAFDLCV
jgi:nucleotide-binding universal stress UspA family protein